MKAKAILTQRRRQAWNTINNVTETTRCRQTVNSYAARITARYIRLLMPMPLLLPRHDVFRRHAATPLTPPFRHLLCRRCHAAAIQHAAMLITAAVLLPVLMLPCSLFDVAMMPLMRRRRTRIRYYALLLISPCLICYAPLCHDADMLLICYAAAAAMHAAAICVVDAAVAYAAACCRLMPLRCCVAADIFAIITPLAAAAAFRY